MRGALALEHGVGGDRRAVHETADLAARRAIAAAISPIARRTASAGSPRVVGSLISRNEPSGPAQTMSVNVPPISTPMV